MRTTTLFTTAVAVTLLTAVPNVVADERETVTEIRSLLAEGELDAAKTRLEEALQEYPDSQQVRSLHRLFASYLSRADRHSEAAEHAAAGVDHVLAGVQDGTAPASLLGSAVLQMTSAYREAGQVDEALKKLDEVIEDLQQSEGAEEPEVQGAIAKLQAQKVTILVDEGREQEGRTLLDALYDRAKKAVDTRPEDDASIHTLAEVLAARSELAGTAEDRAAARQEYLDFLAGQAKQDGSKAVPLIKAYYSSEVASISQLAREDAKQAAERLEEFETFVTSLNSEDEAIKGLQSSLDLLLGSLKRRIDSAMVQQELIGKPAFPLDAEAWVNGDPLTDEDLKGKVVLLDFWAVWCGPCIATFPHLREWRERYGEEGLVIIGATRHYGYDWNDEAKSIKRVEDLSPEDEQAAMVRFAEHHELEHPFMIMPEGSDFSKKYGVTGIPTAVLVDREGLVRMIRVGSGPQNAKDLEAKIEELVHGSAESAGG